MKKYFKKQFEKEKGHLQNFPIFNPVFHEAYGKKGIILSLVLGAVIYLPVFAFYFPKDLNYDEETLYLLIGLVGVGGLVLSPLFSSYVAQFFLNLIDIISWHNRMELIWTKLIKVLFWLCPLFLVVGIPISFHPTQDVWGWFVCFLGGVFFVLFVQFQWLINYYFQKSQEGGDSKSSDEDGVKH